MVTKKRRKKVGSELRVDAVRVAGPLRVVLEPLLWLVFGVGILWILIAVDPALRDDSPGSVVTYKYAGPLGLVLGTFLVLSTVSALLWLSDAVTATRSRAAMAGLGMLGSGWLFTRLHPVHAQDFEQHAWFSFAAGALLIAISAVPWPTSPSRPAAPMTTPRTFGVLGLLLAVAVVSYLVWDAASEGLMGIGADGSAGWQDLLPLIGVLVLLLAGVRFLVRRPDPRGEQQSPDVL